MYPVLFGVGAGFIIISLLAGEFIEFEGPAFLTFFKPTLIAVFLVVTGGLGLLLAPNFLFFGGESIAFFISVLGGLGVAALTHKFVIIPMRKAQNTSAFNIQDTIGINAEIISPIPQGGYGKISYNVSGSVVTSPAKSEDGNAVERGAKVQIIYVEKNTYFVRRLSDV